MTKPLLYLAIPGEHCKTRNPGATAEEKSLTFEQGNSSVHYAYEKSGRRSKRTYSTRYPEGATVMGSDLAPQAVLSPLAGLGRRTPQ
jgi:hypothetical protein